MAEKVYSISEAAALVTVETHVLRYWEEELDIDIRRNEMGHRCYGEKDVKILQRVKTLKDKGIQLKAIKDVVHKMYEAVDTADDSSAADTKDSEVNAIINTFDTIRVRQDELDEGKAGDDSRIVDFKMAQFQNIMDKIVGNSIKDNMKAITQSVSTAVTENVVKQMDVLMRENEEQEEARYRKLDATIRELQHARQEIAATEMRTKKRGLFGRKK